VVEAKRKWERSLGAALRPCDRASGWRAPVAAFFRPPSLPPPSPPPAASLRVRAHLGENAGRDGTVGVPVRVRQPECDFHCADCKSDFIGPLIARGTFDN